MKTRGTQVRLNVGAKTAAVDNHTVHKHAGVFVNSICTSTEPLVRETVRITLEPAKAKSK